MGSADSDNGFRVRVDDRQRNPKASGPPPSDPKESGVRPGRVPAGVDRPFLPPDFERAVRGPVGGNFTAAITAPFGGRATEFVCARVQHLIKSGVSPYSVLVLVGNRGRRRSCLRELNRLGLLAGPAGAVEIQTYYGLANRTVGLFWPKLAPAAGFSRSAGERLPVKLTFETVQYLMSQLIAPLLDRGYFEGLPVRRQRVLSQLLDNLNKAAVNGYPMEEVAKRLQEAWAGEAGHRVYFQQGPRVHRPFSRSLPRARTCRFLTDSGAVRPLFRPLWPGTARRAPGSVPPPGRRPARRDGAGGAGPDRGVPLACCDSSLLLCDGEGGGTGCSWESPRRGRTG